MRVCFVVNPVAGRGRGLATWRKIETLCCRRADVEVRFTRGKDDARIRAREAAVAGFDRVVAVGGDGTVSEVVNGLVGTGASLGVIPAGTGNDFIRSAGIPADPSDAAATAFVGRETALDVATANGRYFINVGGVGLDAEVVRDVSRIPGYFGGTIAYLLGVFKNFVTYTPAPVEIIADGQIFERKALLVAVGNGLFYGGGMKVLPAARLDDGLLDVCIAGNMSRPEILRALPRLYRGTHLGLPKVEMLRAREVTITSHRPLSIQVDGEIVGHVPVTFRVEPGALKVVVPETGV